MTDVTVLVVDDSLTVRMDLAEAFEAIGFRCVGLSSLAEAKQVLSSRTFDLLVLDVLLPDGDGIELLQKTRAAPGGSSVPVMVLSTEAEVKDRVRGLQTGADEYVGKPYDTSYVVARARELVQRRRQSAQERSPTVLVIDDSPTFRATLAQALASLGYAVLTANSGEEGLKLAAGSRPEAIIVDGMLPGVDGATVVRRIRLDAALRRTPCLLLTASEDEGAELRALDAGADAFVRKEEPVDVVMARLAAVIRRAGAFVEGEKTASLQGPQRLLAVDDSPTYLEQLAEALRPEGYEVVLARSGEEALEALAVQPVECVLLDVLMPGLSGQETCQRIKQAPGLRDTPVILLTALEDREAMIQGLSTGADDFIPKSADLDVVKARVRAQIRRKQFEDENRRFRDELRRKDFEAAEARAARALAETKAALVDELERKNKELEAFSYSVSHDLRAPLRSIDGFSQALLEDYSPSLTPKAQDYLRRIRSAAQRMGELIDDLLQLSRVGRAELRRFDVDLSALAHKLVEDFQRRQPERAVEVHIERALWVSGDHHLLGIALDNLLGNALKFTAKSKNAKIQLGVAETERGRAYFIRDNGAGFDMRYANKLFQPFQRLHTLDEYPGTGIGLATVHRIIDRHGGRVWAEAEVGGGATFYFTLPWTTGGGNR